MGTEMWLNMSAFLTLVCSGGGKQTQMVPKGDYFGVPDRSASWHPKSLTAQRDVTDQKADRLNYWGDIQLHF